MSTVLSWPPCVSNSHTQRHYVCMLMYRCLGAYRINVLGVWLKQKIRMVQCDRRSVNTFHTMDTIMNCFRVSWNIRNMVLDTNVCNHTNPFNFFRRNRTNLSRRLTTFQKWRHEILGTNYQTWNTCSERIRHANCRLPPTSHGHSRDAPGQEDARRKKPLWNLQ